MTTPRTAAAAALLEARRDAGLTLRALEPLTGVDHTHLSKLEHGHERPDLTTLATVLRACGWTDERITAVVMAERIGRVPDDVRAVIEEQAATAALESRVEAVARRLCVFDTKVSAWADQPETLRRYYLDEARGVLGLEVGT